MTFWETMQVRLVESGEEFLSGFANSVIAVLIILAFFAIGYLVAMFVAKIINVIFKKVDLNGIIKKIGLPDKFAGFTIEDITVIFAKVFIVLAFLGAATEMPAVSLGIITDVITWIISYIPSLIQGLIVVVVAMMFASYISKLVTKSKRIPLSSAIAFVLQIFIGYTALVISIPLILPNADVSILRMAFEWFIAATAIAFGIGLGIAIGFSLRKPIEKAAEKHPGMFDYMLGQVEGSIRKTRRKGRKKK